MASTGVSITGISILLFKQGSILVGQVGKHKGEKYFIACIYIIVENKYLPKIGIDHKVKESKDMLGFYAFGTMVTVGSEDQWRIF